MATIILPNEAELRQGDASRASRDRKIRFFRNQILPRIILIIMCAIFVMPFYWMVTQSLKSNEELTRYPPTWFVQDPQWENYKLATEKIPFWMFFRNTVFITAMCVIGSLISNPIIAYGFSRVQWPGRDKIFMIVLATVFMPFPAIIVAYLDVWTSLGLVPTFWPLIIPSFLGSAFFVFLLRQFMLQIPMDLSDAARMDGANEFQIFANIIMPLTKPALGVIAILSGMGAWNDFLGPLIFLLKQKLYTLAIGLTFFQSQADRDIKFNLMMAASVMVVLPVVVIFLFFQRFFVQGMTVGAVKG
ncbi:MAG: carbohydrate ABC transporter permease [Thermomicrobiales bacterium]|nr:carbohydrate ABC transporter permease [Thermomicrobiales bacterium]